MTTEVENEEGITDKLKEHLSAAFDQKKIVKSLKEGLPAYLKKLVDATGYYTASNEYRTNKHAEGQLTFSTNASGRPEFVTLVFHPGAHVEITRVISRGRDGNDVKPCPVWDYSQCRNVGEAVAGILRHMGDLDPEGFGKYIDDEEFNKNPEPVVPAEPAPAG